MPKYRIKWNTRPTIAPYRQGHETTVPYREGHGSRLLSKEDAEELCRTMNEHWPTIEHKPELVEES